MTLIPETPTQAVRIVPLQRMTQGEKWRAEAMRSYRAPLLLWFTKGQGRITVAGTTRGFGAHNAIYIPANTMHGFQTTAQIYGTAAFFGPEIVQMLPTAPIHLRIRDQAAQSELTSLLDTITREAQSDRLAKERALLHHAGLVSVWLERQAAAQPSDRTEASAATALAKRFTDMVEDQLMTGLNVSDYAEALGITPTHLSRVCRQTCGKSALEILQDRLTFEARRLLIDTALPIGKVGELLGFQSPAYFTRSFTARTGQSPSQFRQLRQNTSHHH